MAQTTSLMTPWLGCLGLVMLVGSTVVITVSPSEATPAVEPRNAASPPMLSNDAILLPPRLRDMASPAGTFHLILTAPADWATKQVTASLFTVTEDRCQPLWSLLLPHEYGPRLAVVNPQGNTLLLDEWINVASTYAITVMDSTGNITAQYSFDDIVTVTGKDRADLVATAEQGFWLAGTPTLDETGDIALIPTADGHLTVDFNTGDLRFTNSQY